MYILELFQWHIVDVCIEVGIINEVHSLDVFDMNSYSHITQWIVRLMAEGYALIYLNLMRRGSSETLAEHR